MNPTHLIPRIFRRSAALLASIVSAGFAFAASPVALDHQHPGVRAVMALQDEVTPAMMATPAILGTAVGADDADEPVMIVYVDRDHAGVAAAIRSVPVRARGIAIRIELTEKFRAFAGKPGGGGTVTTVDHRGKQTAPIQLGTSGGWRYDLANGYCCGGTLGALIEVNGVQYILSNYHVFEADIVSGGNNRVASLGDFISQPGLIDVNCDASKAQNVGTLVPLSALPNNNVDCSIAQVIPGMVAANGAILAIGTISSTTAPAALRQAVKKSGRTTGFTRSSISGLNATISVTYENECAGGTAFTKTFSGQIVVANKASKFLAGGDSGSLMVQDVATSPKAVGLLYAGSSTSAIANPINEVLTFIGTAMGGTAKMVGN
jgi:hypothetical protein